MKKNVQRISNLPICTWETVDHWKAIIERSLGFEHSYWLKDLYSSWQTLKKEYDERINICDSQLEKEEVQFRNEQKYLLQNIRNISELPIEAFFGYVSRGMYPPPEILLSMETAFAAYLNAEGDISFNDVFFGRGKRKAGNYSIQNKKSIRDIRIMEDYVRLIAAGYDKTEAATIISEELGGKPEPESILKIIRKMNPGKKKAEK